MKTITYSYQVKIDNKIVKVVNEIAIDKTLNLALIKMQEHKSAIEAQYKKTFPGYMRVSCEINKII